jgi:hypothetical protein
MSYSYRGFRIASSRFGMEYPRPYALGCDRLSGPPAREPADRREGEGSAGETPLVREPMAGETSRHSDRRSWPRIVMQAARWPDELRNTDRQYHRGLWHYINWPFKPEGQPASVQIKDPESVNILTALVENESIVKNDSGPQRKAVALAWLFHLVGDIHQPLHTAQLFTVNLSISKVTDRNRELSGPAWAALSAPAAQAQAP